MNPGTLQAPSNLMINLFDSYPLESQQDREVLVSGYFNSKQTRRVVESFSENLLCKGSTNNVKLIITNHERTAYYNDKTFTSVLQIKPELNIGGEIPKCELGRISRMANFLTNGERFRYIRGSSTQDQQGKKIIFMVREGNNFFQAKIHLETGHHSYTTIETPFDYIPKKKRNRVLSGPSQIPIIHKNLKNLEERQ